MIEIDENAAGQRIDNFLLRVCKGVPKSHIYRILRSGEVRVNKGRIDAAYRLELGDLVRVPPIRTAQPDETPVSSNAPAAEFPILFEDDHLIVIDKPSGVAVHGGSGVAFGVIEQLRNARPHAKFLELVHRLDRETSGVLMLAKKRSALVDLHEQIRENRVDKRYYAVGHGDWASDWGRRRIVKAPLHKYVAGDGERRVRIQEDGLPSHTVFNLIERWDGLRVGRGGTEDRAHAPDPRAYGEHRPADRRRRQVRRLRAEQGSGAAEREAVAQTHVLARISAETHASGNRRLLQLEAPLPAECRRFIEQLKQLSSETQ